MPSDTTHLTANEHTAFMAGRADAQAAAWRRQIETAEPRVHYLRQYAEECEAERDHLLGLLAKRKETA